MPIVPLPHEEQLGRYRLAARLGRGGMAELFLGRLIGAGGFEKLVAIKRMLPHLSEDPQFVEMFENEGRITASLHHPNLCEVYELGEVDGQLFLAMEFLRGLPWSEIVAALPDEPQAPFARFVVGMLVQACEGLHHAHTAVDELGRPRPVVHRDVSPSNLMITPDGIVKLLDFGVSKILTERKRTQTGMLKGKLAYMAPEQIKNHPLDARSDVFSLGVIAWEAIAGRALFDRPSDYDMFKAVMEDEIPSLPATTPVMYELDAVIRRALSREPDGRQASARAFADELRRAIAPVGDAMPPSELQLHFAHWLEPSLARRNREIAEVLASVRGEQPPVDITEDESPSESSSQRTRVRMPTAAEGVRLRDRSMVVTDQRSALTPTPTPTAPSSKVTPAPTESWSDPIVPVRASRDAASDTLDRVIAGIAPPDDVDTVDQIAGEIAKTAPRRAIVTPPPVEDRTVVARRAAPVEAPPVEDRTLVARPRTPSMKTPVAPPPSPFPLADSLAPADELPSSVSPTSRRVVPRSAQFPPPRTPAPAEVPAPVWKSWTVVIALAILAIAVGVIIAFVGP